jgi:hypothetical protein
VSGGSHTITVDAWDCSNNMGSSPFRVYKQLRWEGSRADAAAGPSDQAPDLSAIPLPGTLVSGALPLRHPITAHDDHDDKHRDDDAKDIPHSPPRTGGAQRDV